MMKTLKVAYLNETPVMTVMCDICENVFDTVGPGVVVMCPQCGRMVPGLCIINPLDDIGEEE